MLEKILVAVDGSEYAKKTSAYIVLGSVSNKVNHSAYCTCITVH